ncbi:MAG: hypothetical protein ILP11_00835 [Alphaproteobacteria bacterium]|nr:hypothetical protein [Alphaproteobacteria bacterium]
MLISNVKPIEPQHNDEIALLFNNIDLIICHKQQIMARAEYKNIRVKGTGIDGLFMGHLPLFLGDLLTLWEAGAWRNQQKFYYHLGGSPLSGISFCTYWQHGQIACDRNTPSFCTLLRPACQTIEGGKITPEIRLPSQKRTESALKIKDLVQQLERS